MNALAALVVATALAGTGPAAPLQRVGLFIGSNDGGPGRVPLRYATTDAQAVARVLQQLGGIADADATLMLEPKRDALLAGFEKLRTSVEAVKAAGGRTEALIYFSGHADETGLLLGAERLDYPELRHLIEQVPADVRVAIVDSCHAGALIRTKGGQRVPAFLVDDSTVVRGQAFLTASSAHEAAQESERIKGSFFTSALITGLRGAADTTRDGKVTLTEAYQFAFGETLAKTERSSVGPQHPAYDIHLAGTGDLVMTDVRATSAGLAVGADVSGRLYVRDASGRLVAELHKVAGHALELGLEPGDYTVTLEGTDGLYQSGAALGEGQRFELTSAGFAPAAAEPSVARGPTVSETAPNRWVPMNLSLVHPLSTAGSERTTAAFSFNLLTGRLAALRGFELGVLLNSEAESVDGVQIVAGANWSDGSMDGLQIAGGLNVAGESARGVQIASANVAGGSGGGLQIGGAFNVAGDFAGGQMAAVNVARRTGTQMGAVNLATTDGWLQMGAVNLAGWSASQWGAVILAKTVSWLQMGAVNLAGRSASQMGAINLAATDGWLQLGAVNVGGHVRLPIGVINVAEEAEAPIGLINWIANGYKAVTAWGTDVVPFNVGVKLGGTRTYSFIGIGGDPLRSEKRVYIPYGLGIHTAWDRWFLDGDLGSSVVFDQNGFQHSTLLSSLRIAAGYRVWDDLAIVGGPVVHTTVGWEGHDLDVAKLPGYEYEGETTTVRVFPGFMLGVQM